jgi:hypothetical protein
MQQLRVAIVCVADCTTKYLYQSLRFVQSVATLESRHDLVPVVGYFDGAPAYFLTLLERLGANLVKLERYSTVHGPSNKLAILALPELLEFDVVVLGDCDIIFVNGFDDVLERKGFQAKIADQQTIPNSILSDVFALAGTIFPSTRFLTTLDRESTVLYCNSGLLIFSREIFQAFVRRWFFWNDLILKNQRIMKHSKFFTDQASLCLTAEEFSDAFHELGIEMNYPLHHPLEIYPPEVLDLQGKVIHYHDAVDDKTALIDLTRLYTQHQGISRFNETYQRRRELISGAAFWDFVYSTSRDYGRVQDPFRQYRVALIDQLLSKITPRSVVDLGCGICPLLNSTRVPSYIGVDFSNEALAAAVKQDPLGVYKQTNAVDWAGMKADLVLLVDVLPYCSEPEEIGTLAGRAAEATNGALVISGLHEPIETWNRPPTFFHSAIEETLTRLSKFHFRAIGQANAQSFYLGVLRES